MKNIELITPYGTTSIIVKEGRSIYLNVTLDNGEIKQLRMMTDGTVVNDNAVD